MRYAWHRMLIAGVVLTAAMLYFAVANGFIAGYLLAILGVIFIVAASVNLKNMPPD